MIVFTRPTAIVRAIEMNDDFVVNCLWHEWIESESLNLAREGRVL